MGKTKFIIVGIDNIDKDAILKRIVEENDDISIIKHFSTDISIYNKENEFIKYIDINTLHIAYKNNAVLTVLSDNGNSDGIMVDDFYNNDICSMNIEQFNMVPDKIFNENDILIIWVDISSKKNDKFNVMEIRYMQERLEKNAYIYLLNDDIEKITLLLNKYLMSDEIKRKQIIEEYC